jgi:hypothetical protein
MLARFGLRRINCHAARRTNAAMIWFWFISLPPRLRCSVPRQIRPFERGVREGNLMSRLENQRPDDRYLLALADRIGGHKGCAASVRVPYTAAFMNQPAT